MYDKVWAYSQFQFTGTSWFDSPPINGRNEHCSSAKFRTTRHTERDEGRKEDGFAIRWNGHRCTRQLEGGLRAVRIRKQGKRGDRAHEVLPIRSSHLIRRRGAVRMFQEKFVASLASGPRSLYNGPGELEPCRMS